MFFVGRQEIASSLGLGKQPRKYDLSNTNIGMLGTPLEKSVKAAAAQCEDQVCEAVCFWRVRGDVWVEFSSTLTCFWQWRAAGKAEGIQIWRIEQFKVCSSAMGMIFICSCSRYWPGGAVAQG